MSETGQQENRRDPLEIIPKKKCREKIFKENRKAILKKNSKGTVLREKNKEETPK
jgi:hypothetical protein